jgi:hypothetical protein
MNWSLDREQKTNFFLFERETPCYSAVMSNFEIGASEAYKGQSAAESEGGGGGEHSRRNPLKNQDSEKEMKDNGTCEPGFAARRYAKSMTGTRLANCAVVPARARITMTIRGPAEPELRNDREKTTG